MEAWRTQDLGFVATLQRGYDLPHRDRRPGTVPVVTSSGLGDMHSTAMATAPGVVTGRYGTIGQVFYLEEPFWPLNTTLYVRNFHGNDPLFVSYLLRTIDFQSHSGKSGVPGVNRNDLHKLTVRLPASLPEQKAIAATLSDVDALLGALDRLIAKKSDLKQAAMQQLLTGQTRLPGFSGKWAMRKLGSLAHFRTGPFGSALHKSDYTNDGIPVINPMHIIDGRIVPTSTMTITEQAAQKLADFRLRASDVVIGRRGDMGRCAVVQDWQAGWLCGTGSMIVRTSSELFASFLQRVLASPRVISAIEDASVGTTMINLNQGVLAGLNIETPSFDEQTAIAAVLADMDAELVALEQRRDKTRLLKQGMMQELLTGRTRLV